MTTTHVSGLHDTAGNATIGTFHDRLIDSLPNGARGDFRRRRGTPTGAAARPFDSTREPLPFRRQYSSPKLPTASAIDASAQGRNAFTALLNRHPWVAAELRDAAHRLRGDRLGFLHLHRSFLESLKRAGVDRTNYPFNTMSLAKNALRAWLKRVCHESHTETVNRNESHSRPESVKTTRPRTQRCAECPNLPYEAWDLDESIGNIEVRIQLRARNTQRGNND